MMRLFGLPTILFGMLIVVLPQESFACVDCVVVNMRWYCGASTAGGELCETGNFGLSCTLIGVCIEGGGGPPTPPPPKPHEDNPPLPTAGALIGAPQGNDSDPQLQQVDPPPALRSGVAPI
jgi:hypothetical protein